MYIKLIRLIRIAIGLSAFVILSSAFGETKMVEPLNLSTQNLVPACESLINNYPENRDKPTFLQGLCLGIILGVEDNAAFDKKVCIPKSINMMERLKVVRDYISSQSGRSDEAFASLAFDALYQKWPCEKK